jgi:hypothetical protein
MVEMHHIPESDIHQKVVFSWEENNVHGLTPDEQLLLFAKAIKAIEGRTLRTLSLVTVSVILDRVIKEAKEKYPSLSAVKVEPMGLDFTGISSHENHERKEVLAGLRYLVAELLRVLGSITADILTDSLHKELLMPHYKKHKAKSLMNFDPTPVVWYNRYRLSV